jgi:phage recombination protein Bet
MNNDLFGWEREHTHAGDEPDTSVEAAQKAKRAAGPQAMLVFGFLLERPMTQDELRAETGLGDNAAKRCSDLHNMGWITEGGRSLSAKGNGAVLWVPTDFGIQCYQTMKSSSILDFPALNLGTVLRPLNPNNDLLTEFMHTEEPFLTEDEVALLKRTALKGFNEDQQASFIRIAQRTRLDPFTKQLYATRRKQKDGTVALVTVTAVLGLTAIAERTGTYDGCELFWCGEDGVWKPEWLSRTPPVAAKAIVYHKQRTHPEIGIALWDAYAGYTHDGRLTDFWKRMPEHMIGKCAKALALRGAYPDQMSGLYAPEELEGGVSETASSDADRIADIQKREEQSKEKLAKEPGVRIVAASGGTKPTPEEAAEEAYLKEEEKEEPPPIVTQAPTEPAAARDNEEAEAAESQDDLDMAPPKPDANTAWKDHIIQGLKHKNYFGRKIGDLNPQEMGVIENQWLPAIREKWAGANEHQKADAEAFEAAISYRKMVKPW